MPPDPHSYNMSDVNPHLTQCVYLGFYVAFNTVQVISRRVVGRAEETSTYSSLGFCTVNCRPTARNYELSHLRACRESNPGLRGGRRVLNVNPHLTRCEPPPFLKAGSTPDIQDQILMQTVNKHIPILLETS